MKKVIFSIIITFLFFFLIELTLRFFNIEINTGEGPIFKPSLFTFKIINDKSLSDRDIFIETGPKVIPIDSLSYRVAHKNLNKQINEYRILAIGDSCTYGLGVKPDETFSYYLERLLAYQPFKKVKVFNFGYPGYTSLQGLMLLEKNINIINPDLVIAWFGANDSTFAPFVSDKEFYKRIKNRSKFILLHNVLYKNLVIYRLLRNINIKYFRRLVDRSFHDPSLSFDKTRVSYEEFKNNLRKIKEICLKHNTNTVFIWHCSFSDNTLIRHSYEPEKPYLDLYEVYKSEDEEPKVFFADSCHPSIIGHKLIASKLKEKIEKEFLNN